MHCHKVSTFGYESKKQLFNNTIQTDKDMYAMPLKIRLPFLRKGLFVLTGRAFPFLQKAFAFSRDHFSRMPEWLRPIPVWMMTSLFPLNSSLLTFPS